MGHVDGEVLCEHCDRGCKTRGRLNRCGPPEPAPWLYGAEGAPGRDVTRNQEVADLLYAMGGMLDIQGVPFKPRAYQRAAQNIEALGEDIQQVATEGRLGEIPGIGE